MILSKAVSVLLVWQLGCCFREFGKCVSCMGGKKPSRIIKHTDRKEMWSVRGIVLGEIHDVQSHSVVRTSTTQTRPIQGVFTPGPFHVTCSNPGKQEETMA